MRSLNALPLRCAFVVMAAGCLSLVSPATVNAQSNGRSQMMDDFYQSLLNVEQNRYEIQDHRQSDPGYLATHGAAATATPEQMTQIRRVLPIVALEADRFADLLNQNIDRTPRIREVWSKVLQLRARINYLAQRVNSQSGSVDVITDLRTVDRDWRVIANHLEQTRNMDPRILDSVQKLNGYAKQISQSLSIDPQLDRTQLIQHMASLSAGIRNLLEDVEFEVPDLAERNRLILEGQRLEQQVRQISYLISDSTSSATVIEYYKRFQKEWYPFSASLRKYNSRYLERSVRRIASADGDIHELLWLPHQVDRHRLLHVTAALEREVDEFFTRAPLKLLISLPDSDLVMATSNQFYGVCENFVDGVNSGEDLGSLADSFRYVEDGWREFNHVFLPIKSQKARTVLTDIEKGVASLREALQVTGGPVDQYGLADRAAELNVYASNLGYDLRRWLSEERPTIARDAEAEHKKFVALTQHMHEALVTKENPRDLRRDAEELSESWRRMYGYVTQCRSPRYRDSLLLSASKITPSIIELRSALIPATGY